MQAFAVGLGIDRDGGDAQLLAGANHPQGDLPAVRDQHLPEHQLRLIDSTPADAPGDPSLLPDASTPETLRANSLGLVA